MFTPTNTVGDDGTECPFFCMNLDFSTFFTDFSRRRFRCTIASILKQKTLQRLLSFFWENLVFRLGTVFSASVLKKIQKIYRRFFVRYRVGTTAFRWKIAAVNFNSQQKFYDNGASAVLRRLTGVSAELPVILEK